MAADFNKPVTTDNYSTVFAPTIVDNIKALAYGLDPVRVSVANLPTNSFVWRSANRRWEYWNGSAFVDVAPAGGYAISISGNAATATSAGKATNLANGVLGSLPYQSAANTTALLAPNTTTTPKLPAMTGTGSAGAAPQWKSLSEVLDFIGSAAQGDILYRGASAWARLPAGTAGYYLKTMGTGANPAWSAVTGVTLGTPSSPSGVTYVDFTGLPAGTKRIQVMVSGLSTNGTSSPTLQIGDSGGVETTGYSGQCTSPSSTLTWSGTGALIGKSAAATSTWSGIVTLTLQDASTNTWAISGTLSDYTSNSNCYCAGHKSLSAALDRIRITTDGGTDTFDAGKINIAYE